MRVSERKSSVTSNNACRNCRNGTIRMYIQAYDSILVSFENSANQVRCRVAAFWLLGCPSSTFDTYASVQSMSPSCTTLLFRDYFVGVS